jgi:hypothetical protein
MENKLQTIKRLAEKNRHYRRLKYYEEEVRRINDEIALLQAEKDFIYSELDQLIIKLK